MEKPRSSTDIRIVVPCRSCNMLGKIAGQKCDYCEGTGWELRNPEKLSPTELERLLKRLPPRE
jgi:DnaJ-class molecular chaperone